MSQTILVSGATGQQGGATVDALCSAPGAQKALQVLALTRNTESPAAIALASKYSNVTLLRGDLEDCDAVFKSANTPIWGVFSVQQAAGIGDLTKDGEERQGKGLIDAALAHGVKHFVYASADRGGDERSPRDPTYIKHFITKYNIEKHLKERTAAQPGRMTWTILRPTGFMENLKPGFPAKVMITGLKVSDRGSAPIFWISCKDIGWFAAESFRQPDEWASKEFSLAGDRLSIDQVDDVFKQKTGAEAPTTFHFLARLLLWWVADLGTMFRWLAENPYEVDVQALRKIRPEMLTLGDHLDQHFPKQ